MNVSIRTTLEKIFPTRQKFFDAWVARVCNTRVGDKLCNSDIATGMVLKFIDHFVDRKDIMQHIEDVSAHVLNSGAPSWWWWWWRGRPPQRQWLVAAHNKSTTLPPQCQHAQ